MDRFTKRSSFKLACEAHGDQMYGDKPYSQHLCDVAQIAIDHLPESKLTDEVLDAIALHDVLEDTHLNYIRLLPYGRDVADAVACCSGFGKGRHDRQEQIRLNFGTLYCINGSAWLLAVIVKVCDRIANVRAAKANNPSLFKQYLSEAESFERGLAEHAPKPLLEQLALAYEIDA